MKAHYTAKPRKRANAITAPKIPMPANFQSAIPHKNIYRSYMCKCAACERIREGKTND